MTCRHRVLDLALILVAALIACGGPSTGSRGARYVISNATEGDLDARAKELCGPGIRYAINTQRVSSAYTIGSTEYYRGWTAAEVLCENPNISTDPDDGSQSGYCIAGRGKPARVENVRRAKLVAGELVVDEAGAIHRLGTEAGKATPIDTLRDVSQLSHDGNRYCALHTSRSATCFVLEPGKAMTNIQRVDPPVRAVVADIVIKEDGSAWRQGSAPVTNVVAAGSYGGRVCVAKRDGGIACQTERAAWAPVDLTTSEPPEQIWMTANGGFAVAAGKILGSFPGPAGGKAPELPTSGDDYTSAASGFRLACLGRSGHDALCWDMLSGSVAATSRHLHGVKVLRASGNALCGLTQESELVCVGEQRRTSRSVTSLGTMLRGVNVARGVASFDLTETLLAVVLTDGTLIVHVAGDC